MSKPSRAARKALRLGSQRPAATRDSFVNFQSRLGYGAGSQADGGHYRVDYLSRNRMGLDSMYRSSWICGQVVDVVAEDMTRAGIELGSELDPADADELMSEWEELGIWSALSDTIKWARLYGGAGAVMLIDGQDMKTPLDPKRIGKDQFRGLLPMDRWTLQPDLSRLVKTFGPDFGKPEFYTTVSDAYMPLPSERIHYSRVIRFDGVDLPFYQRQAEMLWGQSVLERLYDRLVAFDSTTAGAAQLVYKAHLRTIKIEGLREIIAAGGPILEAVAKNLEFIRRTQTNEGLTVLDLKDEFETQSYTFSGLDLILLQFGQQLSGAAQIPLVRLFGQSPSGLNSTGDSDFRNYYDGIHQNQKRRMLIPIKTLLEISYRSVFGREPKESINFSFAPLWQMTDTEKATIAGTVATAVTAVESAGIIRRDTALKVLKNSGHQTGIFTEITDEEIEEAENEPPPAPEGMEIGEPGEAKPNEKPGAEQAE